MRQAIDIQAFRATFARALLPTQRWPNDMKNTQLIDLLATFSPEEMKGLGDYVQSPFFNKRQAPMALYKALCPMHPTFAGLKWEKVFRKAFPDKPTYSDTYLRNVLSDLCTLAEHFLGQQAAQPSPLFMGDSISQLLRKRQFKLAECRLKDMATQLEQPYEHFTSNEVWQQYYYHLKMRLHDRQEQRAEYSQTQQLLADMLVRQCIDALIHRYSEMLNDQQVYHQYPYEMDFYERFWQIVRLQDLVQQPKWAIKYYKLRLQIEKSWQAWLDLYEYCNAHKHQLPDVLLFLGNISLSNFIIDRERRESIDQPIAHKHLELLEENAALRLRNGLMLTGDLFENIVKRRCKQYGADAAKAFLADHQAQIPPNIREGLVAYCQAQIAYYDGNFRDAIALIATAEPFYSNYYFPLKFLLLLCYYVLDEYDAFMAALDTFRHTLNKHPELARKRRDTYIASSRLLLKLYHLRRQYKPALAQELQTSLDDADIPLDSRQLMRRELATLINTYSTNAPPPKAR